MATVHTKKKRECINDMVQISLFKTLNAEIILFATTAIKFRICAESQELTIR